MVMEVSGAAFRWRLGELLFCLKLSQVRKLPVRVGESSMWLCLQTHGNKKDLISDCFLLMHLNRNLMRRSLLKDCAYWKHARLADKVWGWEAEGLLAFFFFFCNTEARNRIEGLFYFLLETTLLWEILCGCPFLWLFWNSWIGAMSFHFRMTCYAWSSTAKYLNNAGCVVLGGLVFFWLSDISEYRFWMSYVLGILFKCTFNEMLPGEVWLLV